MWRDPTLQHPRCVFQILKRHFARYTPEVVSQVCGCKPEQLVRVAELLCANSGRDRTRFHRLRGRLDTAHDRRADDPYRGHSATAARQRRSARRRHHGDAGHSTIQGSTDIATLYDALPGYLPQPAADEEHETLDSYVEHEGMQTGYWANFRKFIVSLLKAWYGDAAKPENDFRFPGGCRGSMPITRSWR